MKKALLLGVALSMSISLLGCATKPPITNEKQLDVVENNTLAVAEHNDETVTESITNLVEDFGSKLQMVSLLSPADVLKESMEENYIDFVSPDLLAKWTADPENAPGKLVSSPWPDRIEVESIEMLSDEEYMVEGKIIEITSVEIEKNEAAAKRAISLKVVKLNDSWIIDDVSLGEYDK